MFRALGLWSFLWVQVGFEVRSTFRNLQNRFATPKVVRSPQEDTANRTCSSNKSFPQGRLNANTVIAA